MGFFDFLKSEQVPEGTPLQVDMHSHLIHGVDDGSQSLEETLDLLSVFSELGYKKIITTPHVMHDYYRNSYETLKPKHDEILEAVAKANISIEIDFAAEHYLDEGFGQMIKDKSVLTFGDNYVLFETNFMSRPQNLEHVIFDLQSAGYRPVFAHPERYIYLYESFDKYEELFDKGLLFQLNSNSLSGYYSKGAKKIAEKLIDNKMLHFAGTDCHGFKHIEKLKDTRQLKYYKKLLNLDLKNNSLL